MASLEKALGCQLFLQNNARPLELSDAGKKAYRRMETLLRAHDQLIEDLRSEQRSIEGRVRLSTAQGFATRHLMPVLEKFRHIHQIVECHRFRSSIALIDALEHTKSLLANQPFPSAKPLGFTLRRKRLLFSTSKLRGTL